MNQNRWPQPGGDRPVWVDKATSIIERYGVYAYLGIGILALLLWLATGIYIVSPGEQGVVRMFGRHYDTTDPGLNYRLPWPIQTVDVVNVASIRRTEVGFRTTSGRPVAMLEESLMLTKDENIVDVQVLIQYRVKDASAYLFKVQRPDEVLASAAEVALRSSVGRMRIDDVITERRAEVQTETQAFLERLLDSYQTGIQVTDVRLQVADAPQQVRDAFHEVVRAREDRERLVNEAQAYMEDILPRARGVSRQIQEESIAYREERVRRARGEASRFSQVIEEYRRAPDVTRERMYIESLEEILAKPGKVIMSRGAENSVLPFLPLRGMQAPVAAAKTESTAPRSGDASTEATARQESAPRMPLSPSTPPPRAR
ncbi:MAG: FtsH protease activity modulator HflK [Syntrophobacteraceae bacterium]|jgi:membrane protease subunit HflK|nr:FtsH protease activity modulator HflK [Syntrophobacteraceae bacterium]